MKGLNLNLAVAASLIAPDVSLVGWKQQRCQSNDRWCSGRRVLGGKAERAWQYALQVRCGCNRRRGCWRGNQSDRSSGVTQGILLLVDAQGHPYTILRGKSLRLYRRC